jgi:RNA polymerase sigma-70 factor, ECF subfamily
LKLPQELAQAPDAELARLARDGDESAFGEIVRRHSPRVFRTASRFFRRREQVEEVVQESFAKAFFALGEFANSRDASFAAWLARIAFNTSYDELRRQKRRPEAALEELTEEDAATLSERLRGDGSDAEGQAVSRDLATKLLARLSPEDRLVLVMLDVEGLSVSEIAGLMKWTGSKVKVRAHRARAHLRRVLERFL